MRAKALRSDETIDGRTTAYSKKKKYTITETGTIRIYYAINRSSRSDNDNDNGIVPNHVFRFFVIEEIRKAKREKRKEKSELRK